MAFHEIRLSPAISFGAQGGPMRRTEISELASGFEERNSSWADSKRRYNIGFGIKSEDVAHDLLKFWEARRGQLHGFRYKDWGDYKTCQPSATPAFTDQNIGTGDGVLTTFKFTRLYADSVNPYTRRIMKPVSGTVLIGKAGVLQSVGFTVDTTNGSVTFSVAPTGGQAITWGGEYDVPVRFEDDQWVQNLASFRLNEVTDINLVELKLVDP